jgi:hypothetical protein
MTVKDLIKKLQQYQQIGQIASVRIEFGDGSIYNDPPLAPHSDSLELIREDQVEGGRGTTTRGNQNLSC